MKNAIEKIRRIYNNKKQFLTRTYIKTCVKIL